MFSNEQLTSPDFDEVAYLRYALRAPSYSAEHARLENCIAAVKEDVQATLAEHADSLIDQARCTHRAQREVAAVRQSTDSLQKAAGRLRSMMEEPYVQLQSKVRELEATQEAMQLLQSTLRLLSLTARLQEQVAATPTFDVVRASYTLRELEEVLQNGSIRGLQVVDAQLPVVERHATTIRSKAHELLAMTELTAPPANPGAAASSPASTSRVATQVGTGLQCAYVLRMLSRTVQSFMTERRREVLRTIMRELDTQAIEEHITAEFDRVSAAQAATGGVSEQAVTAHVVLLHIQKTLFVAVQHTQCVILLWRLLLQRRDAQTQEPYLASIDAPVQLLVEYWSNITDKLRERLNSLQKRHAIRLALASAYPRYHHLVTSFLSRTDVGGVGDGAATAAAGVTSGGGALGGGGGGGGAGAGGGLGGTPALMLTSIHVTQCGMGDYLDLIDAVDAAVRRGAVAAAADGERSASATPGKSPQAPRMDTQDLRHTWLAQVSDEVRDAFRTHVLDRHREVISGVLARLSSVVPPSAMAGSQAAAVAPVRMQGSRRPPIPPQANALDLAAYTRLITQEVQVFRQDPHTLDVLLDCILAKLRQVRAKFAEAVKKHPLPPLPAVTAAPTVAQVMHLCIANGCTTLAYDCATVLALVPQPTTTTASSTTGGPGGAAAGSGAGSATGVAGGAEGGGAHRGVHHDPFAVVLEQLGAKRLELQQLIHAFHGMSERATKPFADSMMTLLLPTVTQAVDSVLRNELTLAYAAARGAGSGAAVAGGDSRTSLVQLQSQCRQFTDRFFFLVDARTSGWVEACQAAADTMLARLLTRLATSPPPPPPPSLRGGAALAATTPAYARTLQVAMPPLLQFVQTIQSAGAVGRTTSILRGCVRQAEGFYETCAALSTASAEGAAALTSAVAERLRPPVPRFFAKLLVLQYGALSASAAAADGIEAGGLAAVMSALAAALKVPEPGLLECLEAVLLAESGAATPAGPVGSAEAPHVSRAAEATAAVEARCRDVIAVAPGESAARLQVLWSSIAGS